MTPIGIGTDIVDIQRIEALWLRQGERFAKRLLAESEWQDYRNHAQPHRMLAKRWAAKEAISKALGTGISQGVCFQDMVITHNALGQPGVQLSGAAKVRASNMNITDWKLSISDEKHYAVAFVMALG
jgi:holo-[acyl-carrier protein] synthase